MSSDQLSLRNQLSFALYGAANRLVRLHKPFLEPLGLTFPQYLVMLELLTGGPRSVGELGARLEMETGTLTPILKRLQAVGMVTRTRDPQDERRVLVDLTAASRDIESKILGVSAQIVSACGIRKDEAARIRRLLEALASPDED